LNPRSVAVTSNLANEFWSTARGQVSVDTVDPTFIRDKYGLCAGLWRSWSLFVRPACLVTWTLPLRG